MNAPRALVPESVMPAYAFLNRPLNYNGIADHLRTLRAIGVPYTDDMIANAEADLIAQDAPGADTEGLLARYPKAKTGDFDGDPGGLTEMDALVAYLQMLGTLVDFTSYNPEYARE